MNAAAEDSSQSFPRWLPAYVGVGSNLAEPRTQVLRALDALVRLPRTRLLARPEVGKARRITEEDGSGVQSEAARGRRAAYHLAQFALVEFLRTGPREDLLAVDQRNFQPQLVRQFEAAPGIAAARPLNTHLAGVVGLAEKHCPHVLFRS